MYMYKGWNLARYALCSLCSLWLFSAVVAVAEDTDDGVEVKGATIGRDGRPRRG